MELSLQRLIGNFVVIVSHLHLFFRYRIHETPLAILSDVASFFEETETEVTPDLHIIGLRHFGVHIMSNYQVLYDLKLNQMARRL